jgi:tape measure domain-containing protein
MATISNNEIKIKYTLDTTDLANATALFDRLSAEDRQLLNDLKRLQAQFNATGQAGQAAGTQISNATSNASRQTGILGNSLKQVGTAIAGYFSVQALVSFTKQLVETTIKFEALNKAIQFTSGSISAGLANFKFLEETAKQLGLPLEAAAEGFKSMSAAANRAGITFKDQQKMFLDLSKGMAALSLTAQDASLVFFGFGQLMSKTKVSAQELYHQIGERLPIAMQAAQIAAAKVTGQVKVTSAILIKLVEDGKLMSSEFAPAFTDAIAQIAGESAKIDTLGKNFTRLGNAWDEMLVAMGNSTSGFWYGTTKIFEKTVSALASLFAGTSKEVSDVQAGAFKTTYDQYENASKAALDLAIIQKEAELNVANTAKKAADDAEKAASESLGTIGKIGKFISDMNPSVAIADLLFQKVADSPIDVLAKNLAKAQGELDALLKKRLELANVKEEEAAADEKAIKLYKILIDQQEALKKAEDDRIKSRTRAGVDQDILLLQNNVHFNKEMLKIDEDRRFKNLELAKNNAVKRKAENEKDLEAEQEIQRQAYFKAYADQKEYLDKTFELIQDNKRKRKQENQTAEQNELDKSKDFYDDKIKALEDLHKKEIKAEGLSKDQRELIEINYTNVVEKLEEDRGKAVADIRAKYRQKEKEDAIAASYEVRSTIVEAAVIRNQALAKTDMQRADIAEEGALTQIQIEKQKNHEIAQEQLASGNLSVADKKIINDKLFAQDVLLDAKTTQLIKEGEDRRLEYKLEIFQKTMEVMSDAFNKVTELYIADLNRQKEALGMKYDADVRLADGNKQKLAQLAQDKARKEYEIELKQFKARQLMAIAEVIFKTAPEIARWISTGVLAPVAAIGLAAQAFAIGSILSQPEPVPPYKDGTKGIPHPGGPAIVGEAGVEKVVTTTGQVYYTPPTATLIDLPKGSQVIPNHALSRKELFWASSMKEGKSSNQSYEIGSKLDKIGGILQTLPIHQINMDERGFEKFVRTERRTTKILNNRFPIR